MPVASQWTTEPRRRHGTALGRSTLAGALCCHTSQVAVRHADKGRLISAIRSQPELPWLAAEERRRFDRLSHPRRREDWLCGRFLAKRAVWESLLEQRLRVAAIDNAAAPFATVTSGGHSGLQGLQDLQIHSHDELGRGVRPRLWLKGRLQPWDLSISHCDSSVAVAFASRVDLAVGIDLLLVPRAGRSQSLDFWMTPSERRWTTGQGVPHASLQLWALKEAAYKAMNGGEKFRPRRFEVVRQTQDLFRCVYRARKNAQCQLRAATVGSEILVVALFEQYATCPGRSLPPSDF